MKILLKIGFGAQTLVPLDKCFWNVDTRQL